MLSFKPLSELSSFKVSIRFLRHRIACTYNCFFNLNSLIYSKYPVSPSPRLRLPGLLCSEAFNAMQPSSVPHRTTASSAIVVRAPILDRHLPRKAEKRRLKRKNDIEKVHQHNSYLMRIQYRQRAEQKPIVGPGNESRTTGVRIRT
jgi:hypothetical protein